MFYWTLLISISISKDRHMVPIRNVLSIIQKPISQLILEVYKACATFYGVTQKTLHLYAFPGFGFLSERIFASVVLSPVAEDRDAPAPSFLLFYEGCEVAALRLDHVWTGPLALRSAPLGNRNLETRTNGAFLGTWSKAVPAVYLSKTRWFTKIKLITQACW